MRLSIVMKRNEMLTAAFFLVPMSNSIRFCQCDEEKIYFTIDLISPRAFQEEFSVDFHRLERQETLGAIRHCFLVVEIRKTFREKLLFVLEDRIDRNENDFESFRIDFVIRSLHEEFPLENKMSKTNKRQNPVSIRFVSFEDFLLLVDHFHWLNDKFSMDCKID